MIKFLRKIYANIFFLELFDTTKGVCLMRTYLTQKFYQIETKQTLSSFTFQAL